MRKIVQLSSSPVASYSFTMKPKSLGGQKGRHHWPSFCSLAHQALSHLRTFVHTFLPLCNVLLASHVLFYLAHSFFLRSQARWDILRKTFLHCTIYNITIFCPASETCHITLQISSCTVYTVSLLMICLHSLYQVFSNSPLTLQCLDQGWSLQQTVTICWMLKESRKVISSVVTREIMASALREYCCPWFEEISACHLMVFLITSLVIG